MFSQKNTKEKKKNSGKPMEVDLWMFQCKAGEDIVMSHVFT